MGRKGQPFREKGQNLIEYALLLAIIAGIGFLIYQQSFMGDSIRTVFNNAGNLMENAGSKDSAKEDEPPLSIPDLVGKAVAEGNSGLGALLNTGSTHYVYSGTAEGNQVARALNIPFSEGDAWSIGRVSQGSTDYYVLIYYSASQNGPLSGHASTNPNWSWRATSSGGYEYPRTGSHISVPVDYYVYDAGNGIQNAGLRQTYYTGSADSSGKATLVYAPGTGKEYTIR